MLLDKARQQARQEVLGRAHQADDEPPALDATHPGHRILGVLERGQHPPRVDEEILARGRQAQLPVPAIEQRKSHLVFEAADLHRHGRLGDVKLFGGPGEAQVPRGRREQSKLLQGGASHKQ